MPPEPDYPVWKSYVWHKSLCFFVSTIERSFETAAGCVRGYETLVWDYNWARSAKGCLIHQGGGILDHQQICRCLIAEGIPPDENDPATARFIVPSP